VNAQSLLLLAALCTAPALLRAEEAAPAARRTREEMVAALQAHYDGLKDGKTYTVKFENNYIYIRDCRRMWAHKSKTLLPGEPAPVLECSGWLNADKSPIEKGRCVLVDFSATWCGPCVECMPHVQEIAGKFKERGLVTLIATDEPKDVFEPFALKKKLTLPVALEVSREAQKAFGVFSWPTAMLIGADGNLAYIGDPRDQNLEAEIEKALAAAKP
jgi:thiol-disulfide isomerase/thioredoxin